MNKLSKLFFITFFPFLPFWAYFLNSFSGRSIEIFLSIISLPLALVLLTRPVINLPKYLIFFMVFTIYHLFSSYIINPVNSVTHWIMFILSDRNFLACILFFIIENTHFDDIYIRRLNRSILIIVFISLLVSIIQIKFPSFFISPKIALDPDNIYLTQNRIYSIYSWVDLNSVGITFPIMIAILLSFINNKKILLPLIVISGIAVSFLTKARYVMLSVLIAFSQLFFTSRIKLTKKIYITVIFIGIVFVLLGAANLVGYDVKEVIDERILEKSTNFGNIGSRILSFYVFLEVFPENPMLGVGPETRWDVVQLLGGAAPIIHIGYLSYLYFYGILGSFLLFSSIFLLLKRTWNIGVKQGFWGSYYGLLSFLVANTTLVYFNFSEAGVIFLIIYLRYFKEKGSLKLSELKLI